MIRINLVSEGRRPVVSRPTATTSGGGFLEGEQAALYSLLAAVVIFGAVFVVWYFRLNATINDNLAVIREREQHVAELQEFIDRVEGFEQQRSLLERKVEVITELKNSQRGPVEIMDSVSKALPELLWLDRLQQRDTRVTMWGRAFNTNALSTFLENLDAVPVFSEPTLQTVRQRSNTSYDWQIHFDKVNMATDDDADLEPAG